MRGILLISVGNPYYARMAYQLAFSIKANENIPIAIATNNIQFLTKEQQSVFDTVIEMPEEIIAGRKFIRAKTFMYDLSPFDETIFLDADMLGLNVKKFSELFDELKDIDVTIATRGKSDISEANEKTSIWGNMEDVKKHFEITEGFWYQLSSEFIYFKKNEVAKKYFDTAKKVYDSEIPFKQFGGQMADEFAFGISCLINKLYPHKEKFTPIYWAHAEKRIQRVIDPFINDNFYGFSMGGAYASQQQRGFYDNMLKWYQQTTHKYIEIFPAQSKARYMENRKSI